MMRNGIRTNAEKRAVSFELNVNMYAEGSILVKFGNTTVLCTATVADNPPAFLRGDNKGWGSAEYAMLPRATQARNVRESLRGKLTGRTAEIQRLIGRALRSVVDLEKLNGKAIIIDCDVLQADGGTRTASITGGFIALKMAVDKLISDNLIQENPIKEYVAAISVGIKDNEAILDLDFSEDATAEVDMNIVMTESGRFVEIQGTGEERPFSENEFTEMIILARKGIAELIEAQKEVI